MTNHYNAQGKFEEENAAIWIKRGAEFRNLREQIGLSTAEVASGIGTIERDIQLFERGYPLSEMIGRAYGMFLELRISQDK